MYFQRLYRLTYRDISQNSYFGRLPVMLRSVLQNLPSLDLINLHGWGIEQLPVSMFTNTTRLTNVVLSGNAIKSWNPDVFAPLRHLHLLTLARNKIVSVNVASFAQLTSLRRLDLSLNLFACNCDLMWFLEYVQNNNIFVIVVHVRLARVTAWLARIASQTVARRLRHPHRPRCHLVDGSGHCCVGDCVWAGVQRSLVHQLLLLPGSLATSPLPRTGGRQLRLRRVRRPQQQRPSLGRQMSPAETRGRRSLPVMPPSARLARRSRDQREHRREYQSKSQGDHRSVQQLRSESLVPGGVGDG